MLLRVGLVVIVGLASFSACSGDDGSPPSAAAERAADLTAASIAEKLECGGLDTIDQLEAPIRGGAATQGVSCTRGPTIVHVFERAPIGDLDDSDESYATAQGGSLENIDRLLGSRATSADGCQVWLLVGEAWFVVSNDNAVLAEAEEIIGGAVRAVEPASPPFSYQPPGCRPR